MNCAQFYFKPNPFSKVTELVLKPKFTGVEAKLKIFNAFGQLLKSIPIEDNTESILLDGEAMQKGIYYYSVVKNGVCLNSGKLLKH